MARKKSRLKKIISFTSSVSTIYYLNGLRSLMGDISEIPYISPLKINTKIYQLQNAFT